MEVESWIDGPSSPIPDELPADFQNREILPTGYVGIANSSRKGGISAKMGGKRVFGTIFHPYIVGGRFAWCNGVWFILVCLKIPTVILYLYRYSINDADSGSSTNLSQTYMYISSSNYNDDSLESHFAFLQSDYFEWRDPNNLIDQRLNSPPGTTLPTVASPTLPPGYSEVNLGISSPVKKIPSSSIEILDITSLNQLNNIEILPTRWCWSNSPPYFKDGSRNIDDGTVDNPHDYYQQSKNLGAFSLQQPPIDGDTVLIGHFPGSSSWYTFWYRETNTVQKTIKYPIIPDPTWTGIKNSRTRNIDGFEFIEYAFEVKAQPCDIEITIDPAISSSRTDTFCMEYSDYNNLMNRFDRIEERLNELPP
jgi:hypothetical protein